MANPKPKKKTYDIIRDGRKKTFMSRLNLRLPLELDMWMKEYAKERNTTVSRLIVDYFTDVRKKIEGSHVDQF